MEQEGFKKGQIYALDILKKHLDIQMDFLTRTVRLESIYKFIEDYKWELLKPHEVK